jgi:AmmeMemoRadiSam system protein A
MSPPRDIPAANIARSPSLRVVPEEFSREERALLLQLAHQSVLTGLDHREIPLTAPSQHLAEPRGVFTTIHVQERLRGCVGYVRPIVSPQPVSLYRAVAETARAAAFEDSRFSPLTTEEALQLHVSLSILSLLKIVGQEEVIVGLHGLMVSQGERRGLLLPQVPIEHAWDRTTFLQQTCRKAGLAPDAWQNSAVLEVFTAEVFGDLH